MPFASTTSLLWQKSLQPFWHRILKCWPATESPCLLFFTDEASLFTKTIRVQRDNKTDEHNEFFKNGFPHQFWLDPNCLLSYCEQWITVFTICTFLDCFSKSNIINLSRHDRHAWKHWIHLCTNFCKFCEKMEATWQKQNGKPREWDSNPWPACWLRTCSVGKKRIPKLSCGKLLNARHLGNDVSKKLQLKTAKTFRYDPTRLHSHSVKSIVFCRTHRTGLQNFSKSFTVLVESFRWWHWHL